MKTLITLSALAALTIPAFVSAEDAGERPIDDLRQQRIDADVSEREQLVSDSVLQSRLALAQRFERVELNRETLSAMPREELALFSAPQAGSADAVRTVTILAAHGDIAAVAEGFGLSVVYQDQNTGLAVLDLGNHDDVMALVRELRASDLVRAARPTRTERQFELDVINR